ncbi:MAG: hypothetical protein AAFO04_17530 [Cyanobacteria bacterium J06592_8]
MASSHLVKQYLAYWLQLGKAVVLHNGDQKRCPQPIFSGNRYSWEFEQCWQEILCPDSGDCYLEGTEVPIRELLTSSWEIEGCARCSMPIPFRTRGMPPNCCPCFDLPNWPNSEIPQPRLPADTRQHLVNLCSRLTQSNSDDIASA